MLLAVATAAFIACVMAYLVPVVGTDAVQWQTRPYGVRPAGAEVHRYPGYLWAATVVGLYGLALLPGLLPRRLASHRLLVGVSRTALVVLMLVSLLLVLWLVVTPMFS